MHRLLTRSQVSEPSAPAPDVRPVEYSRSNVIELPTAAVRAINRQAFTELCDHVQRSHGEISDAELRLRAEAAILRFPVPVLGPGLRRTLGEMKNGPVAVSNVFRILIDADARLRRGICVDAADALVRAFASFRSDALAETRGRLIQASRDCEFFAPELVLLLQALRYDGDAQ